MTSEVIGSEDEATSAVFLNGHDVPIKLPLKSLQLCSYISAAVSFGQGSCFCGGQQ